MSLESNTVGAYEAKTHFSDLLERVANGEEITITRHGIPVARMLPAQRTSTVEERRQAVELMRASARHHSLGGLKVKDLMNEGRP